MVFVSPVRFPLLDEFAVAMRLGITSRAARKLLASGVLPIVSLPGGDRRVRPESLDAYVRSHESQTTDDRNLVPTASDAADAIVGGQATG